MFWLSQSSNATPKHAPVQSPHTIDSGLASQQTSLFPSDVDMDLPAAVEESHPALGDTGSDGAHVRERLDGIVLSIEGLQDYWDTTG